MRNRVVVGDFAPWAGRISGSRRGKINFGAGKDDQIDATIFRAAFGGIVAGRGVVLGVSGGRDALRRYGFHIEKETGDACGAGRGKLQLESNSAVWMGMLSVWPSMRKS